MLGGGGVGGWGRVGGGEGGVWMCVEEEGRSYTCNWQRIKEINVTPERQLSYVYQAEIQ